MKSHRDQPAVRIHYEQIESRGWGVAGRAGPEEGALVVMAATLERCYEPRSCLAVPEATARDWRTWRPETSHRHDTASQALLCRHVELLELTWPTIRQIHRKI